MKCGETKGKKTLKKKKHSYKYSPTSRSYCLRKAEHYQNLYNWALATMPGTPGKVLSLKHSNLVYKWKRAAEHPYECAKYGNIK